MYGYTYGTDALEKLVGKTIQSLTLSEDEVVIETEDGVYRYGMTALAVEIDGTLRGVICLYHIGTAAFKK